MIHVNRGDKPHEWLTDEQFKAKYPDAHRAMHEPRPYEKEGRALKQHRIDKRLTLRKFAPLMGLSPSELSRYEIGKENPAEIEEKYLAVISTVKE